MEINIDIGGAREMADDLIRRTRLLALRKVVAYHTARIQAGALRRVPVRTGFLKGSIEVHINSDGGGSEGIVRTTAEYAGYVEYGTIRQKAKPYMRPSFNEVKKGYIEDVGRLISDG